MDDDIRAELPRALRKSREKYLADLKTDLTRSRAELQELGIESPPSLTEADWDSRVSDMVAALNGDVVAALSERDEMELAGRYRAANERALTALRGVHAAYLAGENRPDLDEALDAAMAILEAVEADVNVVLDLPQS